MSICEDFPCCGHTDGLGCDWVSPNEITLCMTCANARKSYPYHNGVQECPTEREQNQARLIEGQSCEYYDEADFNSCDGEVANTMHGNTPVCWECYLEIRSYDREMQNQYDEEWSRQ